MSSRWSATIAARNLREWLDGPDEDAISVFCRERYIRQRLVDAYDAGKAAALAPPPDLPRVQHQELDDGSVEYWPPVRD